MNGINNSGEFADYNWSAMLNNTALPLDDTPAAEATVTKTATSTNNNTDALEITPTSTFQLNPQLNFDYRQPSFEQAALSTPTMDIGKLQNMEDPALQITLNKIDPFKVGDFSCRPLAEKESLFTGTLQLDSSLNNSFQNKPFALTGSSSLSFGYLNKPQYYGFGSSLLTSPLSLQTGFNTFLLTPPILSWDETKPQVAVSTTIELTETEPSTIEEDSTTREERATREANLALNLKNCSLEKETIALLVAAYNNMAPNRQEAFLNELTTTVFSAKISEQRTKLIILCRHFNLHAIVNNLAKGHSEHADARALIS